MHFQFKPKKLLLFCLSLPLFVIVAAWGAGSVLSRPVLHSVGAIPAGLQGRAVQFSSASGSTIHGWFFPGRPGAGAVALMHGYRGDRVQLINRVPFLQQAGYSVLAFDFQAHGESPGQMITVGYLESRDAQAAIAFLRRTCPGEKIGVIGLSMGGAASILAAPQLEADALVLEMVYPEIEGATANRMERYLGRWSRGFSPLLTRQIPMRLGISPQLLRPIDHVDEITTPKLFIAGENDRHTRLSESRALFAAAHEPKDLWIVEKAPHGDAFLVAGEAYRKSVLAFFETWMRR